MLPTLLSSSHSILLFTGAGVSTGSGIPDFRGPNGVWKTRQPVYYSDFLSSETARVEYWDQKLEAWDAFRDAEPNAVHQAAADLERAGRLLAVVTQNIDGLHARAGTSPERLIELHGTNAWVECQSCGESHRPRVHPLGASGSVHTAGRNETGGALHHHQPGCHRPRRPGFRHPST